MYNFVHGEARIWIGSALVLSMALQTQMPYYMNTYNHSIRCRPLYGIDRSEGFLYISFFDILCKTLPE
jgi:hypothetical protein